MEESKKLKANKMANLMLPLQVTSSHKLTKNTLLAFDNIIRKVAIAEKSKSPPSNLYHIRSLVFRGRLVCHKNDCFHLTVSKDQVQRAIFTLDCLAKKLEELNFKIKYCEDTKGSFVAAVKDDDYISFHISEGYKYHPIKNELRSEYEKLMFRDREPLPTGKLTLTITARETKISKSWSDGVRPLEAVLSIIISAFESLIIKQKKIRIEKASKAAELLESSKIFRANEGKKYEEKSIFECAIQESQNFITHNNLEAYLKVVETQFIEEYGDLNDKALLWLSAVRKVSESLSPVRKRIKALSII